MSRERTKKLQNHWEIDYGQGWVEFNTDNATTITGKRDLEKGQIYFRESVSNMMLGGKDGWLCGIIEERRKQPSRHCEYFKVRKRVPCAGKYKTRWEGRFTIFDVKELQNCTFSVRPEVVDKYTCFLDVCKEKVNALLCPSKTVEFTTAPNLEYGWIGFTMGVAVKSSDNLDRNDLTTWSASIPLVGIPPLSAPNQFLDTLKVYVREREVVACDMAALPNPAPSPPTGLGWVLLEDNCDTDGTAVWVRPASGIAGQTILTEGNTPPTCPAGTPVWLGPVRIGFYLDGLNVGAGVFLNIWQCSDVTETYTTARRYQDVLEKIVGQCTNKQGEPARVRSDFYQFRPYNPSDTNYVTGGPNYFKDWLLIHSSDYASPNADEVATNKSLTLCDAEEWSLNFHQVYPDIDNEGNYRLEHWSHWVGGEPQDLPEIVKEGAISFQPNGAPEREGYEMRYQSGVDFVGLDIVNSVCAKGSDTTITIANASTDLQHLSVNTPIDRNEDSWVLLAGVDNGSTCGVHYTSGVLSLQSVVNAPFSWADLHENYYLDNRPFRQGTINGRARQFQSVGFNADKEVIVKSCCEEIDWRRPFKDECYGQAFATEYVDDCVGNIKIKLSYSI